MNSPENLPQLLSIQLMLSKILGRSCMEFAHRLWAFAVRFQTLRAALVNLFGGRWAFFLRIGLTRAECETLQIENRSIIEIENGSLVKPGLFFREQICILSTCSKEKA